MSAPEPNTLLASRSTPKAATRRKAYAAERASLTCFLNSLLREWEGWTHVSTPRELDTPATDAIKIELDGATIFAPVTYFSNLGRHSFDYPAYVSKHGQFSPIGFDDVAEKIVAHLPFGTAAAKTSFLARVRESQLVLAEVLEERRAELSNPDHFPADFIAGEQYLVIGHSFHPNPKSREGFSDVERRRYGPEYAGRFPLAWFAVHHTALHDETSAAFGAKDWVAELMASDESLLLLKHRYAQSEFKLLPMNPWQADYLQKMPRFKAQIDAGLIQFLGEHGEDWYPTSSVRAIARRGSPYMIKTSLNVKLTNSVRSLMVREVERGLQVHDVFATPYAKRLLREYPDFHVLYEPAYRAVKDATGAIIEESIAIARSNPFKADSSETPIVLASLTQDSPFQDETLISRLIESYCRTYDISKSSTAKLWMQKYLDIVLEPLFMAQAKYGILLGAHQQNIVVGLKNSLPHSLYFRDCQGTGYSELAYANLKEQVPSLSVANGNVLPTDKASILFVYYLIINAAFNVITSLAKVSGDGDEVYFAKLKQKIVDLKAQAPADLSCLDHLLESPELMHKGNFLCSITGLNENTAADPFVIYRAIKNPLYTRSGKEKKR